MLAYEPDQADKVLETTHRIHEHAKELLTLSKCQQLRGSHSQSLEAVMIVKIKIPAQAVAFRATPTVRPAAMPATCVPCPRQSSVMPSPSAENPGRARDPEAQSQLPQLIHMTSLSRQVVMATQAEAPDGSASTFQLSCRMAS